MLRTTVDHQYSDLQATTYYTNWFAGSPKSPGHFIMSFILIILIHKTNVLKRGICRDRHVQARYNVSVKEQSLDRQILLQIEQLNVM